MLHALAKDRFSRYQSAVEFRTDVETAGAGHIPVHRSHDEAGAGLFGPPPVVASGSELALKQLAEDQTMVRTQRRPPVIWVWAGIVSVVVIVIAVMFWVFSLTPSSDMPDNSRKIPSLAGQTYNNAQNKLLDLYLAATKAEEPSATVPKNEVIRTDPPAGTTVQPAEVIKVFVSTGAEQIEVPDVTNQVAASAEAAITAAGLVPGSVTKANSPSVTADVVLSTDPAAKSSTQAGATINFVVSSGLVTLTDLTGQSLSAASDLLGGPSLQLVALPQADYTCPAAAGSPVTKQSLAPGDVPQKSEVSLIYCAG